MTDSAAIMLRARVIRGREARMRLTAMMPPPRPVVSLLLRGKRDSALGANRVAVARHRSGTDSPTAEAPRHDDHLLAAGAWSGSATAIGASRAQLRERFTGTGSGP